VTVNELLSQAQKTLGGGPSARLDAEVLLQQAMDVTRAWLYANGRQPVSQQNEARYQDWISRRATGEPVAYITGVREFWSLPLKVTPDVLIPRPETELLVEHVLAGIPDDARWRLADLGTGSGAIALALASERPRCEIVATDRSAAALNVARNNAALLEVTNIEFHQADWLNGIEGPFDVIVSNPPYIAEGDPHLDRGDLRFEPRTALTPGSEGMADIRTIAAQAKNHLVPGGLLAFEHGFDQGNACREILEKLGYRQIETVSDLAQLERITSARTKKNRPA
jgi:release factor glutamine methyltransferase